MELERAKKEAAGVVAKLQPHCQRIEVAGSIRRGKPFVHDIDIVCIPGNQGAFLLAVTELGRMVKQGPKIMERELRSGIHADIYIADESTWATLLLIRTGSKQHNIMLCSRANAIGMKLHADGRGLYRVHDTGYETALTCVNEGDIFDHLRLPYKRPEERG